MPFDVEGQVAAVFRVRGTGRAKFSLLQQSSSARAAADILTGQKMEVQRSFLCVRGGISLRGLRSKALNRGGRRGFAECARRFAITTTSAAEQSAGAAYSYSRRRELQLPAVFTSPGPTSRPQIGRTREPGWNSGVGPMAHQLYDLIADEQHSAALALDRPVGSIANKELQ